MEDDKKVVSLSDHLARLQKKEEDGNREFSLTVNHQVPAEVLDDLNACITHEDLEATLRVFETLRTLSDKAIITIDADEINIETHLQPYDDMDAGVDFANQVIKNSYTIQSSTVNFNYDDERWDDIEQFLYNVAFSFRRAIEALTFWATGKEEDE